MPPKPERPLVILSVQFDGPLLELDGGAVLHRLVKAGGGEITGRAYFELGNPMLRQWAPFVMQLGELQTEERPRE